MTESYKVTPEAGYSRKFETRFLSMGTNSLQNDWDVDGINAAIDATCQRFEIEGYDVIAIFGTTSVYPSANPGNLPFDTSATKYIGVTGRRR